MTTDQEHIVTMLFIRLGGFQEVVDTWLYADDKFSAEELTAVNVWLADEQIPKPHGLVLNSEALHQFLTVNISLNINSK